MDLGGCSFSLRSKGNFLYSAATAHSTMDYSTKGIEDDVVDSPPNERGVRLPVCSPSPLRGRCAPSSPIPSSGREVAASAQRKLYVKDFTLNTNSKNYEVIEHV